MPNVGVSSIAFGCLNAVAGIPCVTDCVMAELEKLGQRYRLALR
jgi:rRNA-processing protein FCF1